MARPQKLDHKSSNRAQTQSELAKKTGLPLQRIKRLVRDGLGREADGTYNVGKALDLAKRRAMRDPGYYAGDPETTLSWKQRKLKAEAKIAELLLGERTGKLVAIADVRRIWGQETTRIKNSFLGMGRSLAPLLAHKGPVECQSLIDARVLEILRELTRPHYADEKVNAVKRKG